MVNFELKKGVEVAHLNLYWLIYNRLEVICSSIENVRFACDTVHFSSDAVVGGFNSLREAFRLKDFSIAMNFVSLLTEPFALYMP
jgi:hypothetical protein